jgi:hypothetical protein
LAAAPQAAALSASTIAAAPVGPATAAMTGRLRVLQLGGSCCRQQCLARTHQQSQGKWQYICCL